jgi:hypothetical protein
MRYIIYLILFMTCAASVETLQAQDTRYRVEVLVLTHLHHNAEPRDVPWISDYSEALDFLTPPPPEEPDPCAELAAETEPEEAVDDAAAIDPDMQVLEEVVEEVDPNAVIHVEEMSPVMQDAWRRLRLSAPFRPEQYLSWEQGSQEPFPKLRLHDLEVVLVDDPYAALREPLPGETEEEPTMPSEPMSIEKLCAQSLEPNPLDEDPLPDPTLYYRIDGTVVMRRSRFLHLDLDLQMREAVFEAETEPAQLGLLSASYTEPVDEDEEPAEEPRPSSFLLHDLVQSRQVKTGRMEYFDTPVLGVLAYISTVEPEAQPE